MHKGKITEQLFRKEMVPPKGKSAVSEVHTCKIVGKYILPVVGGDKETVVLIQCIIDLAIQVVKIE